MKTIIFGLLCLALSTVQAQHSSDLRIVPAEEEGTCYNVELQYHNETEAKLASQNYRIFYDAESSKFSESSSKCLLPEESYVFTIVQSMHDIDASGIGALSFEGHLGFINATVLLNDARLDGQLLSAERGWVPTLQLCFETKEEAKAPQIVIARSSLTGDYGRAFVELSIIDNFESLQSLDIQGYADFPE